MRRARRRYAVWTNADCRDNNPGSTSAPDARRQGRAARRCNRCNRHLTGQVCGQRFRNATRLGGAGKESGPSSLADGEGSRRTLLRGSSVGVKRPALLHSTPVTNGVTVPRAATSFVSRTQARN
jgi:hypothetical protein